jgi:hypothetical protein
MQYSSAYTISTAYTIVLHKCESYLYVFLYLVGFLFVVYLLVGAYIRIKMQFWHTQPVFHIYNLKYWLNPPGTINIAPPPVNKFTNLKNNTLVLVDASNSSISHISQFIRDNYMIHDSTVYKPSEADILAYLQCSNQPAFFNVYQESPIAFGPPTREIIGVTSARVLNVTLKRAKKKTPITFPVYYIDNLCVKPGYRKKGIAPEMIQTFYYNISRANPKVNAYLFKREGQLNAIVPIVCYDTYAFDMTDYHADIGINAAITVIEIAPQQLNIFIAFVKEQIPKFDCVILPDISNILNLLKGGNIKLYGVLFQGKLIAAYVFRNLELYYGKKKAVECIAILSASGAASEAASEAASGAASEAASEAASVTILANGFALSWKKLNALTQCEILLIEATADSSPVIKALDTNLSVKRNFKSPTAFFLYNYAAYSVPSDKALLIY